ncbi:type II toxin-antitoxin system RelE family toxin [Marinoscillum furvescens]|uniref:Addiction module RelE/StbE family toxin n=1 Tax=Marinoscillum furvescens DSM 4134 TaxID=1122208 RepID=A0A3D9L5P7_MARFU|nr:type II toxin-antitoxin system RelE/ParE family toxin [Marinoscillum furvescens]RED98913.1 addiction module RelE/StbE family toxin [Marinoscillum furvescens DSM 4134]
MNLYKITITRSASKELKKLPRKVNNQLIPLIKGLAIDPRPASSSKLRGNNQYWRIRSGNYRIIYSIDDHVQIIDIIKIGHRKDVYRD